MDRQTATWSADDLAIVIPTVGRWDILEQTLSALEAQSHQGFEVIVVSDGAGDPAPVTRRTEETFRFVAKKAGGPGAARNAGVAATGRSLILFLGDDMIPEPELVGSHLAMHARHKEDEAAAMGRVVWHPDVEANELNRWLDRSGTQFDYANIERERASFDLASLDQNIGFGRFYSCNISLKKAFFDSVGGFDESFIFYYEDLDLGWRLADKGLALYYQPEALARHLHAYDWTGVVNRFRGIALGERLMAQVRPEFVPFFHDRVFNAVGSSSTTSRPGVPRARNGVRETADQAIGTGAAFVSDRLPEAFSRIRAKASSVADDAYHRRLAGPFLDAWDGAGEVCELRQYLGKDFRANELIHHEQNVDHEAESATDEATFYRTSQAYLYDLTVFAMSNTKARYFSALRGLVAPGAKILDYGCGIGSDGLRLEALGYDVSYADFDNPSTRYLRWRLDRRGSGSRVYDVDKDEIPGDFDAVYCFDVIEHIAEPLDFLVRLEGMGRLVMVNFLGPEPGDTHLHHDLDIDALVAHAAGQYLRHYRLHHGRSHLVAYQPTLTDTSPWKVRVGSLGALWQGKAALWSNAALGRLPRIGPLLHR